MPLAVPQTQWRSIAAVALAASTMVSCAAGNSARSFPGGNGKCDDELLANTVWAAQIVPTSTSTYLPQETVNATFIGCSLRLDLSLPTKVTAQVQSDVYGNAMGRGGDTPDGSIDPGAPDDGGSDENDGGVDVLLAGVPARVVVSRKSLIPGLSDVTTQTTTDGVGNFDVELLPGDYELRVLPDGDAAQEWPPQSFPLTVPVTETPKLWLERNPNVNGGAPLLGYVRDALGQGLDGVRVRAVDPATGDLLSSVSPTDDVGAFSLWIGTDVKVGDKIELIADGGTLPVALSQVLDTGMLPLVKASLVLSAPALPDAVEFTLPVSGRSTSGATVPVGGARVDFETVLESTATTPPTTADFTARASTDDDGHATVKLLPGGTTNRTYRVRVTPTVDSSFAGGTFDVDVNSAGGVLSGVTLDGRVLVKAPVTAAGVPVRAVKVLPHLVPSDGTGTVADLSTALPEATTGSDGVFVLWLEKGAYDLDFVPSATTTLPRWSIDRVSIPDGLPLGPISLPQAESASVRVVDASGEPAVGVSFRIYALRPDSGCGTPTCANRAHLRAEGTTGSDGAASIFLGAR